MQVVGIVKVDFPDKKDSSKRVQGVSVHFLKPINFEGGKGCIADKVFLSDWYIENRLSGEVPDVGDDIEFSYNKKGKLDDFRIHIPTK